MDYLLSAFYVSYLCRFHTINSSNVLIQGDSGGKVGGNISEKTHVNANVLLTVVGTTTLQVIDFPSQLLCKIYLYTCYSTSENLRLIAATALALRLEESKSSHRFQWGILRL